MAQRIEPQEPFKRVSVAEAKELIAAGTKIIDVRTPTEYSGGHIPDAVSVPLDSVLARPTEVLKDVKDGNVLFVCQVGQRSALAAEMAAAIGLENLYNLEGGTDAWIRSGNSVDR